MIKNMLYEGKTVVGPWCTIPSPDIIHIFGTAGMDFVIIDMEHGAITYEVMTAMIRAADATDTSPIVRVAGEHGILHALDAGAHGVLVPHIESVKDATKAISHAKYHPIGKRGFSPFTPAGGYEASPVHAEIQNELTMLGLILEGINGVKNLDAILSIPDIEDKVDLIYIGAYDLSQSLGHPGDVDNPDVRGAMFECIDKIRDRGIVAGGYVAKGASDIEWMALAGMQFITLLPDSAILYRAVRDFMAKDVRYGTW